MSKGRLTTDSIRQYIAQDLLGLNQKAVPSKLQRIGVELELFAFERNSTSRMLPAKLYVGDDPLVDHLFKKVLEQGEAFEPYREYADRIVLRNGSKFLFEPGGQLEISTKPCKSLKELEDQIQWSQNILDTLSAQSKFSFQQTGTSGIAANERLNQLQKPRYLALESYLNTIGPFGREMMLNTCSLHINVDLGFEEPIKVKRILASNLLAPFATAIFANSYKKTEMGEVFKSYRSYIWQHMDVLRTGILPISKALKTRSIEGIIDAYLKFMTNAPVIHVKDLSKNQGLNSASSFEYWLRNPFDEKWPNKEDVIYHASLLFPEVRFKSGYLELRSVDAPPSRWQMMPVVFYWSLLYNNQALDKTLALLSPYYKDFETLYKKACYGLDSQVIFKVSQELMSIALKGCADVLCKGEDLKFYEGLEMFYNRYTARGRTFADDHIGD